MGLNPVSNPAPAFPGTQKTKDRVLSWTPRHSRIENSECALILCNYSPCCVTINYRPNKRFVDGQLRGAGSSIRLKLPPESKVCTWFLPWCVFESFYWFHYRRSSASLNTASPFRIASALSLMNVAYSNDNVISVHRKIVIEFGRPTGKSWYPSLSTLSESHLLSDVNLLTRQPCCNPLRDSKDSRLSPRLVQRASPD